MPDATPTPNPLERTELTRTEFDDWARGNVDHNSGSTRVPSEVAMQNLYVMEIVMRRIG